MLTTAGSSIASLAHLVTTTALVVGAGPAGLAIAACLQQTGVPFLILEQTNHVGATWHQHYDRLHLHTSKAFSALPFFGFPRHYPRYPSRHQMTDYFAAYAGHFQLEPGFGQQVSAVMYAGDHWEVQTQDTLYHTQYVIIATGYNREPYLPDWPGQTLFRGRVLHSSQYKNGEEFNNQRVLVVGFGNSAGEIALDLWQHGARPGLAVRSEVTILPRDLFGIPIIAIALLSGKLPLWLADAVNRPLLRYVIGDLRQYGLRSLPYGPMTQIRRYKRIPLIDVGTIQLIKQGHISIHPGLQAFSEAGVIFTDETRASFDTVILATGYRPRLNAFLHHLPIAYDNNGAPIGDRHESPISGLYFCGFSVSATGMLREIAYEARRIGAEIASKQLGA